MKQTLIILISIILLSSPLFCQEAGVFFLWQTSSGEKIWRTFGDDELHRKYKGEFGENEEEHAVVEGLLVLSGNFSIQPDTLSRQVFSYLLEHR